MPGKRIRAPSSSKRTTKARIPRPRKGPLPRMQKVTMRYFDNQLNLDPAAGVPAVRVYRANDLFDPDQTGGGHQPNGFDQLMAMYEQFCVVSAKITVRFAWFNSSIDPVTLKEPCTVGICLDKDGTPRIGDLFNYQESLYTNSKLLVSNESQEVVVTNKFDMSFLGKYTKNYNFDKDICGTDASSPGNIARFHVFVTPVNGANVDPLIATVLIEYEAYLIDPQLAASS